MSELARKPMYAQMNVGLEPTDISELFELLGGGPHSAWDYRGANGMLQVHHLASLDRLPSYTNTPTAEMVEMWTEVRAGMDKRGCTHFPLVVLKTIDGFEEQQSYSSVPISVVTIRGAQELRVQKEVMLCVDRSLGSRPNDNEVAKNLNNINERIRTDSKNKFRMRAPMRACDERILIEAGEAINLARLCVSNFCESPYTVHMSWKTPRTKLSFGGYAFSISRQTPLERLLSMHCASLSKVIDLRCL